MKITDALLAEHVVFHALFDHIERATPQLKTLGEVRALAELLEGMLVQHSKSEDELLMHYLEETSVKEIAALLSLTAKTVEGRLFQARRTLRRRLDDLSASHMGMTLLCL